MKKSIFTCSILALCGISYSLNAAEISGQVLFEETPVTNASVSVWEYYPPQSDGAYISFILPVCRCEVQTSTEGFYSASVSPGSNYVVRVVPDSYTNLLETYYPDVRLMADADLIETADGSAATNINFSLQQGAWIRGTVMANSDPVSNVTVNISIPSGSFFESARTDSNGTYSILVESGSNYIAEASPERDSGLLSEYYSNAVTSADATQIYPSIGTPAENINFDLEPAARISGTLKSGTNTVSDASVRIYEKVYQESSGLFTYDYTEYATPDSAGSYTAWVRSGSNYVVLVTPYVSTGCLPMYYDGVTSRDDALPLTTTVDEPAEQIDFNLNQGAWISGIVMDGSEPISYLRVEVYKKVYNSTEADWNYNSIASDYTDTNGAYSALVPEGTNYVVFADSKSTSGLLSLPPSVSEQGIYYDTAHPRENATLVSTSTNTPAENINFDMSALPTVSGKVTSNGTALSNATVTIYQKTVCYTGLGGTPVFTGTMFVKDIETDIDGTFSIQLPPGNNYLVHASADGTSSCLPLYYNNVRTSSDAELISLAFGDAATNVNFDLPTGFWIQGTVSDEDGNLASQPYINVYDSSSQLVNYQSGNSDGTYSISAPIGEPVCLRASASSMQSEWYKDSPSQQYATPISGNTGDVVTANFTLFRTDADQDGDGVPDYQEEFIPDGIYESGVDYSNLKKSDTDEDGFDDGEEQRCKTDPANRFDFFQMASPYATPDGMILRWMSASGVSYYIERSTNMFDWTDIAGPTSGSGSLIQFETPAVSGSCAYYRISVRTP